MIRLTHILLAIGAVTTIAFEAQDAFGQCATCPTPTVVNFQPAVQTVAFQPIVSYQPQTGWYPGRLFDRMRLRRWSRRAETVQTTSAEPFVTAFAPMQRGVTQTSYFQPVATVDSCTGCAQTAYRPVVVQSMAPTTAFRPVIVQPVVTMRPVVSMSPVVQTSFTQVDSGCSSCAGQATVAPIDTGCSSCSDGYMSSGSYSSPATSSSPSNGGYYGPTTPQPSLDGLVPTPAESRYPGADGTGSGESENGTAPSNVEDSSAGSGAPLLLLPLSDQVTRRPSVSVHHAVYRPAANQSTVSSRPANGGRNAAPKNVDGWHSAP